MVNFGFFLCIIFRQSQIHISEEDFSKKMMICNAEDDEQ